MSESLREPQRTPANHCYTILQDHGPANGGWGPAALVVLPGMPEPTPFIYTGSSNEVLDVVTRACRELAQRTGKPTRLVKFLDREDVAVFGGSN